MGGVLSNLCDCTHKDPKTEINMFLTQNQTIQFSSPIENLQTKRKEPLTNRSGSTNDNSHQKLKDYNVNTKCKKLKNGKKNIIYNNKLLKKKNNYNDEKKQTIQNKKTISNNIKPNNYILSTKNNSTFKSFNSNFSYCSNGSIPQDIKELLETKGNSEIYIGEKKGKIKEGLGLQIWNKETYFFGIYKDNQINGIGKFISGKTKFKGEFKDDKANGYGIYTDKNLSYEGYWEDDEQSSFGIEKWKDGSIFKGYYYDGKKNGIGTYIFADGNKYEGEFINNAFNGYGIYYFNDNNKYYLGHWENNEKSGFGELITNDKIFMGFYLKDKKNGFGISFSKNQKKYFVGFWENGNKVGPWKKLDGNKIVYGMFDKEGNIKKMKNIIEFFQILEKENLINYKKYFTLSFEDISNIINNNKYDFLINK